MKLVMIFPLHLALAWPSHHMSGRGGGYTSERWRRLWCGGLGPWGSAWQRVIPILIFLGILLDCLDHRDAIEVEICCASVVLRRDYIELDLDLAKKHLPWGSSGMDAQLSSCFRFSFCCFPIDYFEKIQDS